LDKEGAIAMEIKHSRVTDDQMESGANGIRGIAPGMRDGEELSSAMALLEGVIPPRGGREIPLDLQPAEWPESDNYQVALVPLRNIVHLRNETDRTGKNSLFKVESVLLLPLTWRELVVSLRAGVGPSGPARDNDTVRFGDVLADFSTMEVSRSEQNVALTTLEFKLLRFMVQNAGRAITRDEMLNEVWGYENYPCTRTVDNHILRLRQKLELDPAHPVYFHTVHGVGYKFVLEAFRVVAQHKM
jgi:DNA-binding winged helix-turn-helix (wHTH) protein